MRATRRLLIVVATGLVVGVVVLDVLALVGQPRSGLPAWVGLWATQLTMVALVIGVPVALMGGTAALRIGLVALLLLSFVRFGGEWLSIPDGTPAATPRLRVATWDLDVGGRPVRDSILFLRSTSADIVALQELTPEVSAAIAADPGLAVAYPYQALYPRSDALGLGVLSRYPVSGVTAAIEPTDLSLMVDTPIGRLRVVDVHPVHEDAELATDPGSRADDVVARRDAELSRVRTDVLARWSADPTVTLGDIGAASTEPAFGWFTAGMRDAHAEVGAGPGWTYRPGELAWLGQGVLRTDVILTGPGLRPVAASTVCPDQGDHCAVLATLVEDPER